MKKLLLLFVGIIALSCSSDDAPATTNPPDSNTVQVVSHNYTLYETTEVGRRFTFTATLKNNKTTPVNGKVKFEMPNSGGGTTYAYIQDVSLNAGETKTVSETAGNYFQTETLNITAVTFVEAN